MTYETEKQAEKDDEASEPFAESIENRRFGFGSPPGAGDYTNWSCLGGPVFCGSARATQGIGPVRCQHSERPSRRLWAWVYLSTAALRAERLHRG